MHSRTVEQVRTWDSRPFSGGLGTLSELADSDHTGAVVAGDTWLFMLNGRVIGIFEGTMDDVESSGTVYSTPHDSLPLLFAMQEREGRTRAKYFTEDTPLAEADRTLADANFTGYIELSENVLSGDYYLVYYGGTRRSVAFIGQSERVETGDAAFEKAAEEVGLYEVKDVSMTITEIPTPEAERDAGAAPAGGVEAEPEPAADTESSEEPIEATAGETAAETTEEPGTGTAGEAESEPTAAAGASGEGEDREPSEPRAADASGAQVEDGTAGTAPSRTESGPDKPGSDPEPAIDAAEPARSGTERAEAPPSRGESGVGDENAGTESRSTAPTGEAEPAQPGEASERSDSELERMFQAEEEWRRTRSIPALDPDETEPTEPTDSAPAAASGGRPAAADPASGSDPTTQAEARRARATEGASSGGNGTVESHSTPDRVATGEQAAGDTGSSPRAAARAELEKRHAQIEDLESRLSTIEAERSELETDLEAEREERSRLESEVSELEAERDRLSSRVAELEAALEDSGAKPGAETTTLTPAEALAGTNLFVRYGSKGEPTLEALGSDVDPAAVNANLRLEHHTQFETETVQVDGRTFRDFLEDTGEFRFVSWVLRELPYELLETGNRNALGDLFEAVSAIDRIEFDGSVTVDPESGTDRTFALVMRDRMGNPLIVGEYNDGRSPVRDGELETLLDGARDVAGAADSLAGAFYVTASFFEPGALERAENAASTGGLFSRQDKASFVTPDSGTGFHLGLIEDRSQAFHVTVPKL